MATRDGRKTPTGSEIDDWFDLLDEESPALSPRAPGAPTNVSRKTTPAVDPHAAADSWDWLGRPEDGLNFALHPRIGEVVLLPLDCDRWDFADGILAGSQNCRSFNRYRITGANDTSKVRLKRSVFGYVVFGALVI